VVLGSRLPLCCVARTVRSEGRLLLQRSITSNPPENPVYAAAISPTSKLGLRRLDGVSVGVETGRHIPFLYRKILFQMSKSLMVPGRNQLAAVGPGETGETTGIWAFDPRWCPAQAKDDAGRAAVSPTR